MISLNPKTLNPRGVEPKGEISQNIFRLVPGGHGKNSLFFINVLLKMAKCYESYMEKVIRKHSCQAPRQFIGPLRLWSP